MGIWPDWEDFLESWGQGHSYSKTGWWEREAGRRGQKPPRGNERALPTLSVPNSTPNSLAACPSSPSCPIQWSFHQPCLNWLVSTVGHNWSLPSLWNNFPCGSQDTTLCWCSSCCLATPPQTPFLILLFLQALPVEVPRVLSLDLFCLPSLSWWPSTVPSNGLTPRCQTHISNNSASLLEPSVILKLTRPKSVCLLLSTTLFFLQSSLTLGSNYSKVNSSHKPWSQPGPLSPPPIHSHSVLQWTLCTLFRVYLEAIPFLAPPSPTLLQGSSVSCLEYSDQTLTVLLFLTLPFSTRSQKDPSKV